MITAKVDGHLLLTWFLALKVTELKGVFARLFFGVQTTPEEMLKGQ